MLTNFKAGDRVERVMVGFRGKLWRDYGSVVSVSANVVTCKIEVDVPRTMRFDASTGINLLGSDFGWIEPSQEEACTSQ